jgi:RNA polymerase sigma factor (sigma-70 family)
MPAIKDTINKVRLLMIKRGVRTDDAEDVVQEAFARLEAYTRAHEVRSKEAFLVTAATNIARDMARRRKVEPFGDAPYDLELFPDGAPGPDEVARAQECVRRAEAGLARLSPQIRRVLIAQRLEGKTFTEIAASEGLSVSAVEKQVARAVMFLVKWMDGW